VSHRKKIDLATTTDVPILELGHCRPRVLRAPRRQLDGAGDDPLPVVGSHHLLTQSRSIRRAEMEQTTFAREDGVAEKYYGTTRTYCVPVASTLFLHPFSSKWGQIIDWTKETYNSRFAIADGTLRFITSDQTFWKEVAENMDSETRGVIEHLRDSQYKDLNTFEFKSLQVGDDAVMKEIVAMASQSSFHWVLCKQDCANPKHSKEKIENLHATIKYVPDAKCPPWRISAVGHIPVLEPIHDDGRSDDDGDEGHQAGTSRTGEKRKRKADHKAQKPKAGVTAQSLLQQVY